jgi:peptidoglycan/xylan/chitin deacetylase (PgdA/CDA1 family)
MTKQKAILVILAIFMIVLPMGLYIKTLDDGKKRVGNQTAISQSSSSSVINRISSSSAVVKPPVITPPPVEAKYEVRLGDLKIPVLMYHRINTDAGVAKANTIDLSLRVSPVVFEKQMEFLKTKGFSTVVSEDIYNYQYKGGKLPEKPVYLTFDDGYKDNYENAFPVLKKYGLVGEFALITNIIGSGEYMSWDNAREMKAAGMKFSSHTYQHCYLAALDTPTTKKTGVRSFLPTPVTNGVEADSCTEINFGGSLNLKQVRGELEKSKQKLESELGVKIYALIYPFGNYNTTVFELAKEVGYSYGYTVEPQAADGNLNFLQPYKLPRTRVFGQQNLPLTGFFSK